MIPTTDNSRSGQISGREKWWTRVRSAPDTEAKMLRGWEGDLLTMRENTQNGSEKPCARLDLAITICLWTLGM